jgi:hypothetical protein
MNMKNLLPNQLLKRKLFGLLALGPWISGCNGVAGVIGIGDTTSPQRRFKGIGIVLAVDAVPEAELEGVVFYDDRLSTTYASSVVAKRNREIMAIGGARVPTTVRVIWRDHPKPIWGKGGGIDYEGTIIGDYTLAVAERVPQQVLDDIRAHGGGLRLKFRLKPDGVMFGWDIERDGKGTGFSLRYDMPGGDFKEARIVGGKVAEPGWYVGPDGLRVPTDY